MTQDALISDLAEQDIVAIWEYIAPNNLQAADRLVDKIFDSFAQLAKLPNMGHYRPDFTLHNVKFWPVDDYLVIYRHLAKPIEIVRVLNGYRDLAALLKNL